MLGFRAFARDVAFAGRYSNEERRKGAFLSWNVEHGLLLSLDGLGVPSLPILTRPPAGASSSLHGSGSGLREVLMTTRQRPPAL